MQNIAVTLQRLYIETSKLKSNLVFFCFFLYLVTFTLTGQFIRCTLLRTWENGWWVCSCMYEGTHAHLSVASIQSASSSDINNTFSTPHCIFLLFFTFKKKKKMGSYSVSPRSAGCKNTPIGPWSGGTWFERLLSAGGRGGGWSTGWSSTRPRDRWASRSSSFPLLPSHSTLSQRSLTSSSGLPLITKLSHCTPNVVW